jgi:hypothetical protein
LTHELSLYKKNSLPVRDADENSYQYQGVQFGEMCPIFIMADATVLTWTLLFLRITFKIEINIFLVLLMSASYMVHE